MAGAKGYTLQDLRDSIAFLESKIGKRERHPDFDIFYPPKDPRIKTTASGSVLRVELLRSRAEPVVVERAKPVAIAKPMPVEPLRIRTEPVVEEPLLSCAEPIVVQPLRRRAEPVVAEPLLDRAEPVIVKPLRRREEPVVAQPLMKRAKSAVVQHFLNRAEPVVVQPLQNHAAPVVTQPFLSRAEPVVMEPLRRVAASTPSEPLRSRAAEPLQSHAEPVVTQPFLSRAEPLVMEQLRSVAASTPSEPLRSRAAEPLQSHAEPIVTQPFLSRAEPLVMEPLRRVAASTPSEPLRSRAAEPSGNPCEPSPVQAQSVTPPSSEIQKTSDAFASDVIPTQDLFLLFVTWRGDWLLLENPYPPILRQPFRSALSSYGSPREYARTYCALHLLSLWCATRSAYLGRPTELVARIRTTAAKNSHHKNLIVGVFPEGEVPRPESTILVTFLAGGRAQKVFGYVYRVETRVDAPGSRGVKVSFFTRERVHAPAGSSVVLQKLCRVRVFLRQYDALACAPATALGDAVVCPAAHRGKVRKLDLPRGLFTSRDLQPLVEQVHRSVSGDLVTLVDMPPGGSKLVLLALVSRLSAEGPVVVCARDMAAMHAIARKMGVADNGYSVLAVKESEVRVEEDLVGHTLRLRAGTQKSALQVLLESKIVVTVLSELYLADCKAFAPRTVCVVDDAHLHSEAETALAVQLAPRSLVLLGTSAVFPETDPLLKQLGYCKSLFHRLCEVAE